MNVSPLHEIALADLMFVFICAEKWAKKVGQL